MNTFSTRTGDRIVLSTIDRPDGDVYLGDDVTVSIDSGAVRVGADTTGELVADSDRATRFVDEILQNGLQFRLHIEPSGGTKRRSALACYATGGTAERMQWGGFR